MKGEYLTKSRKETEALGSKLAGNILKEKPGRTAFVIGLEGDLGSGKTTFLQGFAKGLGIKEKVLSPTFIIFRKFRILRTRQQFRSFYHVDCYRLKKGKDLLELGFKEIFLNPENIVAIEWSERVQRALPDKILAVSFEFIDAKKRRIVARGKNMKGLVYG
jgi:tRNA threonylcarbamoyladenosine biosynthesis protein TsaE